MDKALNNVVGYYLRTPDGTVYGPVDLITLCLWATDARIIPGCQLSERQDVWIPVETIPELRLNWSVQLMDGSFYGPLNLLAIRVLALENSIPAGARVCEKGMARNTTLNDEMMPLLVEEFHQMLAGCGALLNTTLAAMRGGRQEAVSLAEERGAQLEVIRAKLEKSESDLAASMMSAADFGAKFLGAERALEQERIGKELGKATQLTGETEALARRLETAQNALSQKEAAIQELDLALAESTALVAQQACERQAKMEELEKALHDANRRVSVLLAQGAEAKERFENEQRAAVQQKEALGATLDHVKGQYEALLKTSARKEQESTDKLKQIEKQVKESTEQVAKTLREMEQRERQYRELKNEINQRKQEGAPRNVVVDVDVIHSEVIQAERVATKEATAWITPPAEEKPPPPRAQETSTKKPGILNSVEARLQNELRQWETLNRDQKSHKKNSPKWF